MNQLDLHGKRHDEVPRIFENFIYEHMEKGTHEIEIITGNSLEMKTIIKDIAKEYGMVATEVWGNNGTLLIKLI